MLPFILYKPLKLTGKKDIPLFSCKVSAGFPSPASDYEEKPLNLHEYAVDNDATTYFVTAQGDSMLGVGILPGTMLVVDKWVEATDGDIVVAFLDGECFVKTLRHEKGKIFLCPENKGYPTYEVSGNENFQIFGVVTGWFHKRKR